MQGQAPAMILLLLLFVPACSADMTPDKLRIGVDPAYPPFSDFDDTIELLGFDFDRGAGSRPSVSLWRSCAVVGSIGAVPRRLAVWDGVSRRTRRLFGRRRHEDLQPARPRRRRQERVLSAIRAGCPPGGAGFWNAMPERGG